MHETEIYLPSERIGSKHRQEGEKRGGGGGGDEKSANEGLEAKFSVLMAVHFVTTYTKVHSLVF